MQTIKSIKICNLLVPSLCCPYFARAVGVYAECIWLDESLRDSNLFLKIIS